MMNTMSGLVAPRNLLKLTRLWREMSSDEIIKSLSDPPFVTFARDGAVRGVTNPRLLVFPVTGATAFYGAFFDRTSNGEDAGGEKPGQCYTGLSIKINDIRAPAPRIKTFRVRLRE